MCSFLLVLLAVTFTQTAGFAQKKSPTQTDTSASADASFLWAIRAGGNLSGEKVRSLAVGEDGFIYITGQVQGEADFGEQTLVSRGKSDCFIAKIDLNGKFIWARQIGGKLMERGYGIDADKQGNVFVTGHFQSKVLNFAEKKVTNIGDYDYFTASYDKEGNERWIHTGGGPGYDYGHGLDLMPGGGCIVAGKMVGPATLGKSILETKQKSGRLFVARYDNDGQLIWAKAGGDPVGAVAQDVAVSSDGIVWVCGSVYGNATYDGKPLGSKKDGSLIALRISGKDGTLIKGTRFGSEAEGHVGGIIPDEVNGGCYICGGFKGKLNNGSDKVVSIGDKDIFVSHLNTNGKVEWTKSGGSSGWDLALGISIDNKGNVLVAAFVTGKSDFGHGTQVIDGPRREGLVVSYDHQGKLLWLVSNGGPDHEINEDVAIDTDGNVIFGGGFQTKGNFGKIKLTAKSAKKHGQDIFVAKFRPPNALPSTGSVRPGINKKNLILK